MFVLVILDDDAAPEPTWITEYEWPCHLERPPCPSTVACAWELHPGEALIGDHGLAPARTALVLWRPRLDGLRTLALRGQLDLALPRIDKRGSRGM